MQKLHYSKTHSLLKLHQELLSLPFLQSKDGEKGIKTATFILCGDEQNIYLDVPDNVTPEQIAEIEQVINNHSPA